MDTNVGGVNVQNHFHAPVYGVADLEERVMAATSEAVNAAVERRRRGLGVSA
jgi:hypothetical protein